MELVMLYNKNFFKPLASFLHFLCFHLAEKYDKEMSLKFFEAFSYFAWKFAAVNLKGYFEAIYEGSEEFDGDEPTKKLHGIYLQTLDLVVGIIAKTPSAKLKYLDQKMIGDLFSTL